MSVSSKNSNVFFSSSYSFNQRDFWWSDSLAWSRTVGFELSVQELPLSMQDAQTWPKFRVCIRPVPAKICSNSRCDSLSHSKHFPTIKLQEHQHSFCFMFCLTFLQFQASPGKVCGEISHPKSWCRTAKWHKGLQITSSWSVVKKRKLYVCNIISMHCQGVTTKTQWVCDFCDRMQPCKMYDYVQ